MARLTVYSASGVKKYEGVPSFVDSYLKVGYLEFREVTSAAPIQWEVGDYVDYPRTGLRYKLYTVPVQTVKKQARRDSYGAAFVYQNVQFFEPTQMLDLAPFRDLVRGDNKIHFTTQNNIAVWDDVYGIAERIEVSLNEMFPGQWSVNVVSTEDQELLDTLRTELNYSVDGVTCLGALDKIYELWNNIGWTYSYKNGKHTITIGGADVRTAANTAPDFTYGKGNGLVTLERSISNRDAMATRLYVYGSSKNMVSRYYNNLPASIKDKDSIDIQHLMLPVEPIAALNWPGWGKTDGQYDASKSFIQNDEAVAKYGLIVKSVYLDGTENEDIFPTLKNITIGEVRNLLGSETAKYYPKENIYKDADERVDLIQSVVNPSDPGVLSTDGTKYYTRVEKSIDAFEDTFYGGFGRFTHSIIRVEDFDEDGGELTISPEISGYLFCSQRVLDGVKINFLIQNGYGNVSSFDVPVEYRKDSVGGFYYDFTLPEVTMPDTVSPKDILLSVEVVAPAAISGVDVSFHLGAGSIIAGLAGTRTKTFRLSLKQMGFDINERAALGNGKATITMKSGMCNGRSFQVKSCKYKAASDTWELLVWRQRDSSVDMWFPNADYKIESGDSFVLYDIAMPDVYIKAAAQKLLVAGRKLLAKMSTPTPVFTPKVDAKVIREYQIANSTELSPLRAGMYLHIADEDIQSFGNDYVLIDTVTINEGEANIPTYTITLREKKKVTIKESVAANGSDMSSSVAGNDNTSDQQAAAVSFAQSITEGIKIGAITIDGITTNIFAPETDLSNYYTKEQTYGKGDLYTKTEVGTLLSSYTKTADFKSLTIKVAGTSKGTYSPISGLTVDITAADLGLTAVMRYEGVTTSNISEGSTTNPIVIDGVSVSAYKGMVVSKGNKEFFWTGSAWKEYGDEGSYALKTVKIEGTGYLTGGGTLEANRAIDLKQSVKDDIENGATAYSWGDQRSRISALEGYFNSGVAKEAEKVSNKLTFTGGQSKTYDGSSAVSVAIPGALADLTEDDSHKTVTAAEKTAWNELARLIKIENDNVHIYGGVAADTYVSAGGKSPTPGGGGGSYDRLDSWASYDSSKATWVLSAMLGADLNTRVGILEARPVVPDGVLTTSNYANTLDNRYQLALTAINTGNIGSQSVNYANSAGNANTVDNVHLEWNGSQAASDTWWIAGWTSDGTKIKAVRQSDLRVSYAVSAGSAPASDVYSWAKASTKPSYSYNDGYLSGFGTAAAQNVGAFVYDRSGESNKANADCNELMTLGVYRFSNPVINGPSEAAYGHMLTVRGASSDTAFQIFGSYSSGRLYGRAGTWYATSGSIRTTGWHKIAWDTDIPTSLSQLTDDVVSGHYLPLSGGTITGGLTIKTGGDTKLVFNNTDGEYFTIVSFRENGTEYAYYYADNSRFTFNKDLYVNAYKVYHSGNSNKSDVDWSAKNIVVRDTVSADKFALNMKVQDWNISGAYSSGIDFVRSGGSAEEHSPGAYWNGVSIMMGYVGFQLAVYGGGDTDLKFRKISDAGEWSGWKDIYHSGTANKTDVPWSASSLTLNGGITGVTSIRISGDIYHVSASTEEVLCGYNANWTNKASMVYVPDYGSFCFNNGSVGVGTTSPSVEFQVNGVIKGYAYNKQGNNNAAFVFDKPGSNWTGIGANGETSTIYFGACGTTGAWVDFKQIWRFGGDIKADGNISATGQVTAGTASDARLKTNITSLATAAVLRSLRPVEFDWNAEAEQKCSWLKGHDVGLIAQEVMPLVPSAISNIFEDYYRVDYNKITPYLIKGWQVHEDEITTLKRRVADLENQLRQYQS